MLNVVLDTNVFVSALLSETGAPAKILDAWRDGYFGVVITAEIMAEINKILRQPKFQNKYAILPQKIADLNALLWAHAIYIEPHSNLSGSVPTDPDDEIFLTAAVDGKVDVIISGDAHLLNLKIYQDIPIITPREFLDMIETVKKRKRFHNLPV